LVLVIRVWNRLSFTLLYKFGAVPAETFANNSARNSSRRPHQDHRPLKLDRLPSHIRGVALRSRDPRLQNPTKQQAWSLSYSRRKPYPPAWFHLNAKSGLSKHLLVRRGSHLHSRSLPV